MSAAMVDDKGKRVTLNEVGRRSLSVLLSIAEDRDITVDWRVHAASHALGVAVRANDEVARDLNGGEMPEIKEELEE